MSLRCNCTQPTRHAVQTRCVLDVVRLQPAAVDGIIISEACSKAITD